ncbi:unnamed protein product [Psylliodes chrysocephalus]|uniref:Craniofacial development protein 2-like n=1 Tax=Psylliodes chrysocephalus TaxID=3402493 RepID=A0A9P0GD71_9CUCU|nr:unnamed protein product [Psylliodes chrysocephala]
MQETHLTRKNTLDIQDYIIFTTGNQSRRFGMGSLVHRNIKASVVNFKAVTEKLCKIQIKSGIQNITIVNFQAPTEETDEEIKDEFYEELEKVYDEIPKSHLKIIIEDANAKVGKGKIYKNITGGKSKHDISNNNSLRLINLAIERDMRIMSIHFKRKDIHKRTWIIPGTTKTNQIDHFLIGERIVNLVKNVRFY